MIELRTTGVSEAEAEVEVVAKPLLAVEVGL
jgi:hypothetical protein